MLKKIKICFSIIWAVLMGMATPIWIAAVCPVLVSLCRKLYSKDKRLCLLPVLGFVVIGAVIICLIGWNEYLKCFGVV